MINSIQSELEITKLKWNGYNFQLEFNESEKRSFLNYFSYISSIRSHIELHF